MNREALKQQPTTNPPKKVDTELQNVDTELTEEELAEISGGSLANGRHYDEVSIVVR